MSRDPFPRSRWVLTVLVCVFVLTVSVSAAPQGTTVAVEELTLTGDSVLDTDTDVPYVAAWKPYTVRALITGDPGDYQVCVALGPPTNKREIVCDTSEVVSDEPATVVFERTQWPDNASGQQTVSIVVRKSNSTAPAPEPLVTSRTHVTIVTKNGDVDDDSLSNQAELAAGTDIWTADTDNDGLSDAVEIRKYHTNPTKKDTDGDGLSDGIEVNKYGTNPLRTDSDNDGLSDTAEVNKYGTDPTKADTDGDGLSDTEEIRDYQTDPTKKDTDGDGLPDGKEVTLFKTDPTTKDTDGDGLDDNVEVNRYHTDPADWDTDGDGLGDGVEVHKYHTDPNNPDTDNDGVADGTEIKRGMNPNEGVLIVFGYTVENPLWVGIIGAAIVCLVGGGAIGYRWQRRRRTPEKSAQTGEEGESPAPNRAPNPDVDGDNDRIAPEPVTDEDHIQQLLADSGGRLRQSTIVATTGWSKSKVSRTLSRMEENGQITKITVGRENLITRPGDEPSRAGSAFED
jgi:hypothetical protein